MSHDEPDRHPYQLPHHDREFSVEGRKERLLGKSPMEDQYRCTKCNWKGPKRLFHRPEPHKREDGTIVVPGWECPSCGAHGIHLKRYEVCGACGDEKEPIYMMMERPSHIEMRCLKCNPFKPQTCPHCGKPI